jgi:hypothetical protein
MFEVEEGLPLVTVMTRDDLCPTGKIGGVMLTTGEMAVEVCASAMHGRAKMMLMTYVRISLLVFISSPSTYLFCL